MDKTNRRAAGEWTRLLGLALLAIAAPAVSPGCDADSTHPEGASPIVRPDSEQGRKAVAQAEGLLELRKRQEANARKRSRRLPADPEAVATRPQSQSQSRPKSQAQHPE